MSISEIKIVNAWDRDTGSALLVNGRVVASVNYDEHGSAGPDLLRSVAEGLGAVMGVAPTEEEVSDDAFSALFTSDA